MNEAITAPRAELSAYAPRLYTIQIPKDKIRDVIGSGGKTIRSIVEQTGCNIEVEDDGKVIIASSDEASANQAIEIIKGLTTVPEIGKRYTGTVRRVEAYGAFVEIIPGQDGLLHVSELDHVRVKDVTDYVNLGDKIEVEVVGVDPESGKIRLSRKPLLPPPTPEQAAAAAAAAAERGDRPRGGDRDRGGDRGGPRRHGGGGDRGGRGPRN
jgi:polyribonucleotide nucleotidyltransferase